MVISPQSYQPQSIAKPARNLHTTINHPPSPRLLNELLTTNKITLSRKQYVLAHIFTFANQTINLNNNQCGTNMTDQQREAAKQLMRSVKNYIGIPEQNLFINLCTKDQDTNPAPEGGPPPVTPTKAASTKVKCESSQNKRQKCGSTSSSAIYNLTADTRQMTPADLQALVHNITTHIYGPVSAAIGHPKWTSAKAAMASALWYHNTAVNSTSALRTLNQIWTLDRNYVTKWMTFPKWPNIIKTKLPEGWWSGIVNTTLQAIFHHSDINKAQTINGIVVHHYPIIAEAASIAYKNEIIPYKGFFTFITVQQPSSTLIVNDNRHIDNITNPIIRRYRSNLQTAASHKLLSERVRQKICNGWKIQRKQQKRPSTPKRLYTRTRRTSPTDTPYMDATRTRTHQPTEPDAPGDTVNSTVTINQQPTNQQHQRHK